MEGNFGKKIGFALHISFISQASRKGKAAWIDSYMADTYYSVFTNLKTWTGEYSRV